MKFKLVCPLKKLVCPLKTNLTISTVNKTLMLYNLLIQIFVEYLLCASTILDANDTTVNKINLFSFFPGQYQKLLLCLPVPLSV